jgi:hypothetical protein
MDHNTPTMMTTNHNDHTNRDSHTTTKPPSTSATNDTARSVNPPATKTLREYEQELLIRPNVPYCDRFSPSDLEDLDITIEDLRYPEEDDDRDPFDTDSDDDDDTEDEDEFEHENENENEYDDEMEYKYNHEEWCQSTSTPTPVTSDTNPSTNTYNINLDIPFKNYIARCLLTCQTQELLSAMHPFVLEVVDHYHQGNLPNIDWNNSTRLQPDPAGKNSVDRPYFRACPSPPVDPPAPNGHTYTTPVFCFRYLSCPPGISPLSNDPPGLTIPTRDNLANTTPVTSPSPSPQDPDGISFPAIWTYPIPPSSTSFDKHSNTPPPPPTNLCMPPVNDILKIDNTWTAKACAVVAPPLFWNTASSVGRWAYVPPRQKHRSKKMMMDAHAAAAA